MTTSLDLMQDVYANFLDAYGTQAAEGLVTIGFEPMGIMPGLDPAVPGAGAAALEFISLNADALPELGNGSYLATGRTVSGTYRMMLASAQPVSGADIAGFNALKANAVEMTDNGALGSSQGPLHLLPDLRRSDELVRPGLPDQLDKLRLHGRPERPSAEPAKPADGPGRARTTFLMPLQNAEAWHLTTPPLVYAAPPTAGAAPNAAVVQPHAQTVSPAVMAATAHPSPILAQHALASTVLVPWHPPSEPSPVANNSSPQPAPQPEFTLSFEYCVLQLHRPWLSGDFLADPQWYMAGAQAGDYADGPTAAGQSAASTQPAGPQAPPGVPPATGDTAAAPSAPFSWIPVGCIAIKNLTISSTGGALRPRGDAHRRLRPIRHPRGPDLHQQPDQPGNPDRRLDLRRPAGAAAGDGPGPHTAHRQRHRGLRRLDRRRCPRRLAGRARTASASRGRRHTILSSRFLVKENDHDPRRRYQRHARHLRQFFGRHERLGRFRRFVQRPGFVGRRIERRLQRRIGTGFQFRFLR